MTTETIPPALTPAEWADVRDPAQRADLFAQLGFGTDAQGVAQTIAILNDALLDTDPRKITREWLSALEEVVGAATLWNHEQRKTGRGMQSGEHALAVVAGMFYTLASYLPPEIP